MRFSVMYGNSASVSASAVASVIFSGHGSRTNARPPISIASSSTIVPDHASCTGTSGFTRGSGSV